MFNKPNDKLIYGCITILEKYCLIESHRIKLVENNEYYNLACGNGVYVEIDNHTYNVVRLQKNSNIGINFSLKFNIEYISEKKRKYILTDSNIKIFFLNDQLSQLLFRAEFSLNKSENIHAQPHWQFEPYLYKSVKETDFKTILELRSEEITILDENIITPYDISRMHFSMYSEWFTPPNVHKVNSHVINLTEENTIYWLDGCLAYISEQLR